MSVLNKNIKDKLQYQYNFDTDRLDLVNKFNPDRIVTAEYNAAGTKNVTYDVASGRFIESGFEVVTDEYGNVVVI